MLPVIVTKALAAASANNIATAQTLGAAGNVTLVSSPVVLDTQRRVIITSVGNDTAVTFTVYGTNDSGAPIVDSFAGASGAAATSNLDFRTVTRIAASAATTSITIGTSAVGSTQWFMPNYNVTPFSLDIESILTGTGTFSIETTLDDFWTPPNQVNVPWPAAGVIRVRPTSVAAASASASLVLTAPCRGWRLTINSGAGSVTCEALQAGVVNY